MDNGIDRDSNKGNNDDSNESTNTCNGSLQVAS